MLGLGKKAEKPKNEIRDWADKIATAQRREKVWRKKAGEVIEMYDGEKAESTPYNICYSNTETLLPALYNSIPRPKVDRRYKDEDPLGKAASDLGQRGLEYAIDTNSEEYAPFNSVMVDGVLDALLPGRAVTRVRYDAYVEDGEVPIVKNQSVCYESVKWDRVTFGYARKWERMPWLSYTHDVTEKEATKLFGAEKAKKLIYITTERPAVDGTEEEKDSKKEEIESLPIARVYEVWIKYDRTVRFFSPDYDEGWLKVDEDPCQLSGFYDCPEPLRFIRKSNNLKPTVPYVQYENQAKELNRITLRINKIVEAMKVRGIYDSTISELENVLDGPDNKLEPADTTRLNAMDGSLDKAIWLMPIEKLVTVLQQLLVARAQAKQVIYEVTGIADIIRGASAASETLGAQEIKERWATLRLKRMQGDVQRYARDLLRMTLEIQASKLDVETWKKMTGLTFPTMEEKQRAQMMLALGSQMGAQPDPKMLDVIGQPAWEEVLGVLKDDTTRQYKVDIETNSTVDLEATEDKTDLAELMAAISQFLNGVAPLVENGTMPFQAAQAFLLMIVRRFRFGDEVEKYIKQMQPPKPKDDGKAEAAKLDLQGKQMDMQAKQQDRQMEMAMKQKEHELKMQELDRQAQFQQMEFQFKMQELQAKTQAMQVAAVTKVQAAHAMPKKQPAKEVANV